MRKLLIALLIFTAHAFTPPLTTGRGGIESGRCFVWQSGDGLISCSGWNASGGWVLQSFWYTDQTRARTYPRRGRIIRVEYYRDHPTILYDWWRR